MFRKRLVITIMFILIFTASFIAGYFTLSRIVAERNPQVNSASAQTVKSQSDTGIVTSKTKVIIKYSYIIEKNKVYEKKVEDKSNIKSIIGMKEDAVRDYFKKMNYYVSSFSSSEIDINVDVNNTWPPKCFVVKSQVDEVVIYTVDSNGLLTLPEKTGIYIDMLPTDDTESVIKGKVYENYQEVEELLSDYKS